MWKSWEKEQQQRVEILVEKERTAACNQNNYVCVLLALLAGWRAQPSRFHVVQEKSTGSAQLMSSSLDEWWGANNTLMASFVAKLKALAEHQATKNEFCTTAAWIAFGAKLDAVIAEADKMVEADKLVPSSDGRPPADYRYGSTTINQPR